MGTLQHPANQVERLALVAAAQLGGLNVLQLMNVPMAVALNYGMFRRKEINGTVKNMMLYDMGAQATTATIVGFQVVKTKEKGFAETHPQAQVLGVGYDRTLGGAEMKFRVRDYLADQFNAMGKTKTDVKTVPRAMGKLLKEAERVKLILSANTDCFAQIENVMEDIDFKHPMSREKLMEMSTDLMDRVTGPVQRALTTASMSMENIDQVILVGGGTRVPRVQELLTEFVGQELGKSFSFDLSDKMEDEEYMSASTTEERDSVLNECSKVSEWLDEEAGMFTPVDEFNTKLKVLKDLSAPVVARVREHKERPEALEQLRQSINSSNVFLEKSKEYLIKPKPKEPKVEQVIEPVVETGDGEKKENEDTKDAPEDSKKEDEK